MFEWLLSIVTVAAALVAGSAQGVDAAPAGIGWKEKSYNPKPLAEDLVLPMPCDGAMVLRPVITQGTGWIDDFRFQVGQRDQSVGYKEDLRFDYVAGGFSVDDKPEKRVFYIGKYEVTKLQYDAVESWKTNPEEPDCPKDTTGNRRPKTGVSWFDAVLFGRDYTEFLLSHAPDELPEESGVLGYIRLPTEAEWEYAARGGLAVDKAARSATLFPMPDGELAEYVWYQGSQSAGGKVHPVGLLKPNPLGLHDIVGNASEIVLEPFRLNRRGRLHGQAGGFVARGGDVLTSVGQLRATARNEHYFFDAQSKKPKKPKLVGFRVVMSVPVVVSKERLSSLQDEWLNLPISDDDQTTTNVESQAVATLDQVTEGLPDDDAKRQLEQVRVQLDQVLAERNEARDRSLRALIRVGAFLGNKTRSDLSRVRAVSRAIDDIAMPELQKLKKTVQGRQDADAVVARAQAKIDKMETNRVRVLATLDSTFSYYADTVISVANDHSAGVVKEQLEPVKVGFETRKAGYMSGFAEIFVNHVVQYKSKGEADRRGWLQDISK